MKYLYDHKTLAEDDNKLLKRCSNAIKSMESSAEIILYGSRARGDAEHDSDYDLLIIINGYATLNKEDIFRRKLFPIELETGKVFTVFLINRKEWETPLNNVIPFYQNIKRDGVIL